MNPPTMILLKDYHNTLVCCVLSIVGKMLKKYIIDFPKEDAFIFQD